MNVFKKIITTLVLLALVGSIAVAGGQGETDEAPLVELAYVDGWARGVAITHVAAEILTRMGYEVEATPVANAAMWAALAEGDVDAQLTAWLPVTHGAYFGDEGEYTDRIIDLGPNFSGAALGLIVPTYVPVDSIPELAASGELVDFTITGIDPGAGMMQQTENAIADGLSGLGEFSLLEGSGATMLASLEDAYRNETPIVVTLWAPHWAFGRWDLKLLDDPDGIFGASENIHTMARVGLEEDMPEVYEFLAQTDWQSLDFGSVMVNNEVEGMDYFESARLYVEENIAAVNAALPAGVVIE